MKLKKRKRWSNSIKNHKTYPLTYFIPESEEEIQQIIKEAELYQLQVRAVGSGHSFSDVAITNDYLIDMRDMNHFLIFRSDYLKRHAKKKKLVQVQSGITFRDLNRGLDARKLSLVNMSAIDQQTISGAISTATHGSGTNLLDVSGMVRSIEFISDKGVKFKLEPKNGITDPRRYHADAKLLQEDNLFFAALISLGCFGIVTSYIIEVEEEYWLTESKQLDKWSIVKKQLQDGSIFESYRNITVKINPFKIDDDHTCIVIRQNKIRKPKKRNLSERLRNVISKIYASIPITPFITKLLFNLVPKILPKFLDLALKALKDKKYINTAHKVLYQGNAKLIEHGYDTEFAFDARNTKYLEVIESIFDETEKIAKLSNLYATSPIGLRWVKGTKAMIAPNYGRLTCYIDCPSLSGTKGSEQIINHWQQLMWKAGGRPHWGKISNILDGQFEELTKRYPKLLKWQVHMTQFNVNGTFDNSYSRRIGLTMK